MYFPTHKTTYFQLILLKISIMLWGNILKRGKLVREGCSFLLHPVIVYLVIGNVQKLRGQNYLTFLTPPTTQVDSFT